MAADRSLQCEKRGFEVKMGKSKFPGKPSKIGNRKRVNLSSCALPNENDSSKAAENIYLGLSVFNERFGDNEMDIQAPFLGFSLMEVEEAMAEARVQQKEAEAEYKKQGSNISLWEDFQAELFSIGSYSREKKNCDVFKTKLCFDGGGKLSEPHESDTKCCPDSEEAESSKQTCTLLRSRSIYSSPSKAFSSSRFKLYNSPASKSLQSQAAKKLLDKAKKSNEAHKISVDKKFVLPSHSVHSSRVIKPNKRFLDSGESGHKKLLRSCIRVVEDKEEIKESVTVKAAEPVKAGKVILREARLQLDSSSMSLAEGPFSSSNASSLSPNSQLGVSHVQPTIPGTVVCGVCGAVRFYRFVKQAKKFGIFSCESCRKFISKLIKKQKSERKYVLKCQIGKGLCSVPPIVRNAQWSVVRCAYNVRCEACWLKLCLNSFKMQNKLKSRLAKMLPADMRNTMASPTPTSADVSNKFIINNEVMRDFKWLHENASSGKALNENVSTSKQPKTVRAGPKRQKSKKSNKKSRKWSEKLARQLTELKGPRVKHVCRSASVVLGQPLATFPTESKKQPSCDEECPEVAPPVDKAPALLEPTPEPEKPIPEKPSVCVVTKPLAKPPGLLQQGTKPRKKNTQPENLISMDFWESYDPDEVWETGFSLIGSEAVSVRSLCFLCGSAGLEKVVHCAACCEPYHEFCVDEAHARRADEQTAGWKYDWVCPRCTICVTCNKSSGQQLKCVRCSNSYHTECVDRVGGRLLHSPDRPWVCSACLRCKSCNGVDVSVFVGNLPLCKLCFVLRQKGNYCPLCQRCYEDDDYDSKMMECGQCQCWVHAKCEGLSDEKYQVLSFLPDSVEFICRMCCSMPPAPWWIAVEAELKAGYLGVLKSLSKNRKACTMLRWSPRKQCTCRRTLDLETEERQRPAAVTERKTSIEVINHPTETLKMTLKIMKAEDEEEAEASEKMKSMCDEFNIKRCSVMVEKCTTQEECTETKRSLSPSDSGIGSTDDEVKLTCLTDEEETKPAAVQSIRGSLSDGPAGLFEETQECFCFLEVDSYNSRSKPFSPNLLSIKKKVTTCEYSSLHQFHQDMQSMIETTQSTDLMDVYHQTMKDIFPWFDSKYCRVFSSSQKPCVSVENTPVKATPTKANPEEACSVPLEILRRQPLEYYYSGLTVEDARTCLMCKGVGDGPPADTGRLLYCGQNEWVHCNCALWSGEVFEEIDGSLQNVHSAISRGRSIRCPACDLKGASVGCCARNCQETYHFPCARRLGCVFMDDKTVYCPAHASESLDKLVQNEQEFELRRPVYVELDKRKMKSAESDQIRLSLGSLQVTQLGKFVASVSDTADAILPVGYQCTRLFWSSFEPWRIVRYHFTTRLHEVEPDEGVDLGVNLTIDHSLPREAVNVKLKQLTYFQEHHTLLELTSEDKQALKTPRETANSEDPSLKWNVPTPKRPKLDSKVVRRIFDNLDQKEDENLSDNQNTADLLPPDVEEAIFKDLPHDILDSMQDIFMEPFESNEKDATEDTVELEDIPLEEQTRTKKPEYTADIGGEFWLLPHDVKHMTDGLDEIYKVTRDLKRSKSDVMPSHPIKKHVTVRNHQRSCSLNWNCKLDGPTSKWKKNTKGQHKGTLELLDAQDRTNRYPDHDTLRARLEETWRSQQEKGKENKCLPWHVRMQPRLLQVDGGVDSSSSGSEAGESPQRLLDETGSPRVLPPLSSPLPATTPAPPYPHCSHDSTSPSSVHLPQVDGAMEELSSDSDAELDAVPVKARLDTWFRISQLDGNVDSESEGGSSPRHMLFNDEASMLAGSATTEEEPVKCNLCHCTYRTKQSYQRHLNNCSNDFVLSSSEGELSEEEGSRKTADSSPTTPATPTTVLEVKVEKLSPKHTDVAEPLSCLEVKKDKSPAKPRTYSRKKPSAAPASATAASVVKPSSDQMQHVLVHQPTVIVQDVATPSLVPSTLQYVLDPQQYAKPQLIATPSPLVQGAYQLQATQEQMMTRWPMVQNHTPLQGLILQPPQPQPIVMAAASDQLVLGSSSMFEVVQDPQTGGMYLTSHNQPMLYNMETIVHNTVMQTNQFMSNMMATSSYSQTSTQVYQASKLEQVVNMPSNYIVLGGNSDKLVTSNDIICVQQPNSLLQVPTPSMMTTPLLHQTLPGQVVPLPLRCIQPQTRPPATQTKPLPPVTAIRVPQQPRFTFQTKPAPVQPPPPPPKSAPVIRPLAKPTPRQYEKAAMPKKPRPRPLVDYINNFRSDLCDSHGVCPSTCPEYTPSTPQRLNATVTTAPPQPLSTAPRPVSFPTSSPSQIPATTSQASYASFSYQPLLSITTPRPTAVSQSVPAPLVATQTLSTSPLLLPQHSVKHLQHTPPQQLQLLSRVSPPQQQKQQPAPQCITSPVPASAPAPLKLQPKVSPVRVSVSSHTEPFPQPISIATTTSPVKTYTQVEVQRPLPEPVDPTPPYNTQLNVSISMPSLDDSPPSTQSPLAFCDTSKKDSSPTNGVLLPLPGNTCNTFPQRPHQDAQVKSDEENTKLEKKAKPPPQRVVGKIQIRPEEKGPRLMFEVVSDDGFKYVAATMDELFANICNSVQEMRAVHKMPPLTVSRGGLEVMGMLNHGMQHCLEQLRGTEACVKYKPKYGLLKREKQDLDELIPVKENPTGSARSEPFGTRREHDMFAWLASRHRVLARAGDVIEESSAVSNRRANSLPMAMRYRNLRDNSRLYVGVYRSRIHGKGLFCLREIEMGEMVIEYAGEVIRSNLTDKREKYYTDKGIGCYMFRIDDHLVVDATMKGNAARFINHSCEPNCYSKVVDILGKKHIIIFALRRISIMEELTYDYKFPFEDEKISCSCQSKKCRKYLN